MNDILSQQDCLYIESMRAETIIGVYPHEQKAPQPIMIDLTIGKSLITPALSDQLKDTLDYDQIIALIHHRLKNSRFALLEALAEALCQDFFDAFSVPWMKIRIHKPGLFENIAQIGVQLVRHNPKLQKE